MRVKASAGAGVRVSSFEAFGVSSVQAGEFFGWRLIAEDLSASELIAMSAHAPKADQVGASDIVAFQLAPGHTESVADSVLVTDSVGVGSGADPMDAVSLAESTIANISAPRADSVSTSDGGYASFNLYVEAGYWDPAYTNESVFNF